MISYNDDSELHDCNYEEILKRKDNEIWCRIDAIMTDIKRKYSDDEYDDKVAKSIPWENGEGDDDDESLETEHKHFNLSGAQDRENELMGSQDLDFAVSALSVHESYEVRSTMNKKERKKWISNVKKNRRKAKFVDLHAKSEANEELVNEIYGNEDIIRNTNLPARSRKAMFSIRMSVDPMSKSMGTICSFRKSYQPKKY